MRRGYRQLRGIGRQACPAGEGVHLPVEPRERIDDEGTVQDDRVPLPVPPRPTHRGPRHPPCRRRHRAHAGPRVLDRPRRRNRRMGTRREPGHGVLPVNIRSNVSERAQALCGSFMSPWQTDPDRWAANASGSSRSSIVQVQDPQRRSGLSSLHAERALLPRPSL